MSDLKPLKTKTSSDVLKVIKDNAIQYVNLIFTDMRGKTQVLTMHHTMVDKELLDDGTMFDGSSIAGWKAINESDMLLVPDCTKTSFDPFSAQATLNIFCDVLEPETEKPYERCPRGIARRAEAYVKKAGFGDTAYFGPEAEFFVFDHVQFSTNPHHMFFRHDSSEGPYNSGADLQGNNIGHRPKVKGGYFPTAPIDHLGDLRAEMVSVLEQMGVPVEKHHHEVAASQCELGIKFSTLLDCADNMQLYKYVVHNVANAYGKTATFMPKPVFGDNGSGMHCHQSIWKNGKPLFAGKEYAGLSETALYYIGGIIKHAKALNALTNPTTNSYKRLVPGYEAPVLLAYSSRNRSASCRIPFAKSPNGKRVEVRFPDPTANPYLAYAAMLMAGLDGIANKIHPGKAMDSNLYELPPEQLKKVPQVCGSLREALNALRADHAFLIKGDVFSKDFIDSYIDLRMQEVLRIETTPHPAEYEEYYSA